MKKILSLAILALTLFTGVNAQTGLSPKALQPNGGNVWAIPSNAVDTLVKSTTVFWAAPVSSYLTAQTVSFTVAMDSVGGTPDATFQPYVSNDNVHWTSTGSAIVFNSGKNYWHFSTTVPSISDSCTTVNTNPWTGQYLGIKMTTNSNTQRGVYHITVKAANVY